MTTKTLDRVIELWPNLSEEAREDIVEIAEAKAVGTGPRDLTPYEESMVEQSLNDFKHGRFMDNHEYHTHIDEFIRRLAAKAAP